MSGYYGDQIQGLNILGGAKNDHYNKQVVNSLKDIMNKKRGFTYDGRLPTERDMVYQTFASCDLKTQKSLMQQTTSNTLGSTDMIVRQQIERDRIARSNFINNQKRNSTDKYRQMYGATVDLSQKKRFGSDMGY